MELMDPETEEACQFRRIVKHTDPVTMATMPLSSSSVIGRLAHLTNANPIRNQYYEETDRKMD
jgi:hypothetical protein